MVHHYAGVLGLEPADLVVTSDTSTYSRWIGRRVPARYGGAYAFLSRLGKHAILINTKRIDRSKANALDVVVAEELIHMQDHLRGDHRRHAKHGHDRIALRVSEMTGASLEDIRSALVPVRQRPYRYVYACPGCGRTIMRRRKGTWSCGRCAPAYDSRFVFRLVEDLRA